MDNWTFDQFAPSVRALLEPTVSMPLGPGTPDELRRAALSRLQPGDLAEQAPIRRRDLAEACIAALWLYHGFLDEAHAIVQDIADPAGSYWHAIMHRREGDYSNAKYWHRQAGALPFFAPLADWVRDHAGNNMERSADARRLTAGDAWQAEVFVDRCRTAVTPAACPTQIAWLAEVQTTEWQLLFFECHERAIGS